MSFGQAYRQIAFVIYGNQYLNNQLKIDIDDMPHFRTLHPIIRDQHTGQLLAGSINLILYHLKNKGAYQLNLIHAPNIALNLAESPIFYFSNSTYEYCILVQYKNLPPQYLVGCEEKELWYFTNNLRETDFHFRNVNALRGKTKSYSLVDLEEKLVNELEELKPINWESFSKYYFDQVYINNIAVEMGSILLDQTIANIDFEETNNRFIKIAIFPENSQPNYASAILDNARYLYQNYHRSGESRNDQAFCNTASHQELKLFEQATNALYKFLPQVISNAANHFHTSHF